MTVSQKVKPLELSSTYQHINSILWQMPSAALAISTILAGAAYAVKEKGHVFGLSSTAIQSLVLLTGVILMAGVSHIVFRLRIYQAAATEHAPLAPFKNNNDNFNIGRGFANDFLQFITIMAATTFFGLFIANLKLVNSQNAFIICELIGVFLFIFVQSNHNRQRNAIIKALEAPSQEGDHE